MSATAQAKDLDKREAILEAALELFAERGFHGTAVPLVAQRARVAAGTLYRYFPSKEALVNALYQKWKTVLVGKLMTDFPVEASPREQFRAFWQRMGAFANENPTVFAFLELHHHAPYLDVRSREVELRVLDAIAAIVAHAQKQGVLKPIPKEVLMAMAWGGFVGLLRAAMQGFLKLTPDVLAASEQAMWEAIRA